MGKRGPKPTAQRILSLRSSRRAGKRGLDAGLNQKRPACPQRFIRKRKTTDGEFVRKTAKSAWDRLAKPLFEAGLLVDSYRETFAALCDSVGRFELACRKLDDDPVAMVVETDKGNWVQSPWVAIRNKMYDQIYKGAACFGLTAADLAGVRAVEKPSSDTGKSKFFERAG